MLLSFMDGQWGSTQFNKSIFLKFYFRFMLIDIPIFQDSSSKKHSFDYLPFRETQLGASLKTIRPSQMEVRFKYFSSNHKLCHGEVIHHLPKSSNSMLAAVSAMHSQWCWNSRRISRIFLLQKHQNKDANTNRRKLGSQFSYISRMMQQPSLALNVVGKKIEDSGNYF